MKDPAELKEDLRALSESRIEFDYWLGGETTYRAGGNAAVFVVVGSESDLKSLAEIIKESNIDVLAVGKGSNLLVADSGFEGIALKLGEAFQAIDIEGIGVLAGGAVALPLAARQSAARGLGGFEWAVGVPGTIGGAVKMNAGGHGSNMASCLVSAQIFNLKSAQIVKMGVEQLNLDYRKSCLTDSDIVLRAELKLFTKPIKEAEAEIAEVVHWRRQNQPGGQNAGSAFKNPPDQSAGELLDTAGAKGLTVGSASVSEKHANFIQVKSNGNAQDVWELMKRMHDLVLQSFNISLEPETIMVNFPKWS